MSMLTDYLALEWHERIKDHLLQAAMRIKILEHCKTDEQRQRYEDRWAIEDAAEKIASAIRSIPRPQPRSSFFGLF